MTERGAGGLGQARERLSIGPSALTWDKDGLTVDIDEWTVPLPSRLRGRVRLHPRMLNRESFPLDDAGRHAWWPIAPVARVEVEMECPGLSWQGHGYLDRNRGSEPLERGFRRWDWSRGAAGGRARVLYDATRRDGSRHALSLDFDPAGGVTRQPVPPPAALPATPVWRVTRGTRGPAADPPCLLRTFEDTPFYARSLLGSRLDGQAVTGVHESLDLDRFTSPWVQMMLPFRMPRRAR